VKNFGLQSVFDRIRATPLLVAKKMNNPFEFSVYVAGLAAVTLIVDCMLRGKFRKDFALGVVVIAGALIAFINYCAVHHGHYTKAERFIAIGLFTMCALGSVLFDNANIRAQERGEMSKWGDAIECFDNNYWSNLKSRAETWMFIAFLGMVLVGVLFSKEEKPEVITVANPAAAVVADHSKPATVATSRHSGTHKVHRSSSKSAVHGATHR